MHRCIKKHGPQLKCTKCRSPLTNTHMLRGCITTPKFRTKRYNSTFTHLHQRMQSTTGGRWPILGMDLGHKPITDFKNLHIPMDDTKNSSLKPGNHLSDEGLQDDKPNTPDNPHTILYYILHPSHIPQHHRSDHMRKVGYALES